ncbi:MAG: sigma factor-like helix-turn-helix DNA-binding protein [bacterium]|nr:sigma factor-like helix-turn-helix DNA-binding protein [bacterium]
MNINYAKICSDILNKLPDRQREVISRRFALSGKEGEEKETLESIGQGFGITRERVRQIERDAFLALKPEIKKYQKVFKYFKESLEKTGGLRREDVFLSELAGGKSKNQLYFLLTLGQDIERFGETAELHPLWSVNKNSWVSAQKVINSLYEKLKKAGRPLEIKELAGLNSLSLTAFASYLEISKKIQKNTKGLLGLKDWPEINPRKIKDKAYFALKECQKPLHFVQVASLIDSAFRVLSKEEEERKISLTLPQTVHNELIKDPRFVLVGRGIYALKEWGYQEGQVKDVISNILKTAGRPLGREEVLEKTLKQRLVKENTVLLSLGNKRYFSKTPEGRYIVREA